MTTAEAAQLKPGDRVRWGDYRGVVVESPIAIHWDYPATNMTQYYGLTADCIAIIEQEVPDDHD